MPTLGSLFDGAGTFPFAAIINGITPIWASEIEKFPIQVTKARIPWMKHLGDVTKINGAEIDPVDIITFGSPCQDLSVAGKQKGLAGDRSCLFLEAIRIIKEMRCKTDGRYPRFAVWENVPGAFSSNGGRDFGTVLQEFCRIEDGDAAVPGPPKGKWSDSGEILGDGYSVVWRVLDAQFWGVPQRRRRIFLVADFGGESARKILFECDGLSRRFKEIRKTWQGITGSLAFGSSDQSGLPIYSLQANGIDRADTAGCNGSGWREGATYTLNTIDRHAVVCFRKTAHPRNAEEGVGSEETNVADTINTFDNAESRVPVLIATYGICSDSSNSMKSSNKESGIYFAQTAKTLDLNGGNPACNQGGIVICSVDCRGGEISDKSSTLLEVCYKSLNGGAVCLELKGPITYGVPLGFRPENTSIFKDTATTVCNGTNPGHHQGVLIICAEDIDLRRFTPTECGRLQGMPDWWCYGIEHSDTAEYKMWGNGCALPCVLYVMEGIKFVYEEEEAFGI